MVLATEQNRMTRPGQSELKNVLGRLYAKYNRRGLIKPDPPVSLLDFFDSPLEFFQG